MSRPGAVDSLFHSRARAPGFEPSPADRLYRLAEACRDAGRCGRMRQLLEAYLRLKPDRPEAAAALALTGRYPQALRLAARHLASGLLTPEETFLLGNPWLNVHDPAMIKGALRAAGAAKTSGAAERLRRLHLFLLRSRAGRPAGAPPFFRGRLSIMNAHCADPLLEAGKARSAADLLAEAVKNFPMDEYSCGKLAEALLALGRDAEAFALLRSKERALRSPGFAAWRGQLLLLAGRYAEAEKRLAGGPAASSPMSACWLGAARLKLGKLKAALPPLRRAAADRSDLEAALWLAEALRLSGKAAPAYREVSRVLAAAPSHPWALMTGALLCAAAGRGGEAEKMYASFRQLRLPRFRAPLRFSPAWAEAALQRAGGCRRPERYMAAIAAGRAP